MKAAQRLAFLLLVAASLPSCMTSHLQQAGRSARARGDFATAATLYRQALKREAPLGYGDPNEIAKELREMDNEVATLDLAAAEKEEKNQQMLAAYRLYNGVAKRALKESDLAHTALEGMARTGAVLVAAEFRKAADYRKQKHIELARGLVKSVQQWGIAGLDRVAVALAGAAEKDDRIMAQRELERGREALKAHNAQLAWAIARHLLDLQVFGIGDLREPFEHLLLSAIDGLWQPVKQLLDTQRPWPALLEAERLTTPLLVDALRQKVLHPVRQVGVGVHREFLQRSQGLAGSVLLHSRALVRFGESTPAGMAEAERELMAQTTLVFRTTGGTNPCAEVTRRLQTLPYGNGVEVLLNLANLQCNAQEKRWVADEKYTYYVDERYYVQVTEDRSRQVCSEGGYHSVSVCNGWDRYGRCTSHGSSSEYRAPVCHQEWYKVQVTQERWRQVPRIGSKPAYHMARQATVNGSVAVSWPGGGTSLAFAEQTSDSGWRFETQNIPMASLQSMQVDLGERVSRKALAQGHSVMDNRVASDLRAAGAASEPAKKDHLFVLATLARGTVPVEAERYLQVAYGLREPDVLRLLRGQPIEALPLPNDAEVSNIVKVIEMPSLQPAAMDKAVPPDAVPTLAHLDYDPDAKGGENPTVFEIAAGLSSSPLVGVKQARSLALLVTNNLGYMRLAGEPQSFGSDSHGFTFEMTSTMLEDHGKHFTFGMYYSRQSALKGQTYTNFSIPIGFLYTKHGYEASLQWHLNWLALFDGLSEGEENLSHHPLLFRLGTELGDYFTLRGNFGLWPSGNSKFTYGIELGVRL